MTVNNAFATADFFIKTHDDNANIRFGTGMDVLRFFDDTKKRRFALVMSPNETSLQPIWFGPKQGDEGDILRIRYVVTVYSDPILKKSLTIPASELIKKLRFFELYPNCLVGKTTTFLNGNVTLILNGSVSETFEVPEQTLDMNPELDFLKKTTNSAGIPIKLFLSNF
jgi:hypothetical protein